MASDELHVELRQLIDRAHAEQDEPQHLLDFGRRVLDVLFAPSNLLPHDDELALLRLVSELTLPHTYILEGVFWELGGPMIQLAVSLSQRGIAAHDNRALEWVHEVVDQCTSREVFLLLMEQLSTLSHIDNLHLKTTALLIRLLARLLPRLRPGWPPLIDQALPTTMELLRHKRIYADNSNEEDEDDDEQGDLLDDLDDDDDDQIGEQDSRRRQSRARQQQLSAYRKFENESKMDSLLVPTIEFLERLVEVKLRDEAFARCQVAFEPIERPVASRDLEGDLEAAEIEDDKALRLERDKASVIASILQAIEYCMVSSSRAHQSLTTRLVRLVDRLDIGFVSLFEYFERNHPRLRLLLPKDPSRQPILGDREDEQLLLQEDAAAAATTTAENESMEHLFEDKERTLATAWEHKVRDRASNVESLLLVPSSSAQEQALLQPRFQYPLLGLAAYLHRHLAPELADILPPQHDATIDDHHQHQQGEEECERTNEDDEQGFEHKLLPTILSSRWILVHGAPYALLLMFQPQEHVIKHGLELWVFLASHMVPRSTCIVADEDDYFFGIFQCYINAMMRIRGLQERKLAVSVFRKVFAVFDEASRFRVLEALSTRCPFEDVKSNLLLDHLKEQMLEHWPHEEREEEGEHERTHGFASAATITLLVAVVRDNMRDLLKNTEVIMAALNVLTVMAIRERRVRASGVLRNDTRARIDDELLAPLARERDRLMINNTALLESHEARQRQADKMVEYGFPRLTTADVEAVAQKQRTSLLLLSASIERCRNVLFAAVKPT